jgi:hypothetical protein
LLCAFCGCGGAAQSSRLEKAFLIDVVSKLYIASDSSPVDIQVYELCADMIDVVRAPLPRRPPTPHAHGSAAVAVPPRAGAEPDCVQVVDISCIYGAKDERNPLAYDEQSRAVIRLSNGMVLLCVTPLPFTPLSAVMHLAVPLCCAVLTRRASLREMTRYLALVCIMREENFDRQGVLEYNFVTLKDAITKARAALSRLVASVLGLLVSAVVARRVLCPVLRAQLLRCARACMLIRSARRCAVQVFDRQRPRVAAPPARKAVA